MAIPSGVRSVPARPRWGVWPSWLPTGASLGPQQWAARHRAISVLLWCHVLVVPLYGLLRGETLVHSLAEGTVIAVFAVGAVQRHLRPSARSVMATLGLVSSSAVLTHFSAGLIEMHFHFFVTVVVVSLYQSWLPFLVALGFVVLHHGVGGMVAPTSVYNHPSAINDAWRWALIHGGFILAESAACLVAWRLNERALDSERDARRALQKAHSDLAAAQALSGVGSWETHIASGAVWWSDEMFRLLGRTPGAYEPKPRSFLGHVHPNDRARVEVLIDDAWRRTGDMDFECVIVRTDGAQRIIHTRGSCDLSTAAGDGGPRLMGTCQDITDRKALEAEVEHRALHDALTGLANRALFLDRLEHALSVGERIPVPLTLLYVDVDDFKTVNDNLGHGVGDRVLALVGERISVAVRSSDTVARLGGDEFAVLLENTTIDGGVTVAEKVLEHLSEPMTIDGTRLLVRASIGIATAQPGDDTGDILRHADIAMYAAKRQGKHGLRVFNEHMHSSLTARMRLEAELAEAIALEQLVLYYQPLVDLHSGDIEGVEALVRWEHPTRGLLPPSEFIPVAEEIGLIGALGTWVLRRAARDVRTLQEAAGKDLYVSVNVAAPQLHSDMVGVVTAALAETGLAAEHLLLEITETSLMSNAQPVIAQLEALRRLGVRVAIDDFGTGYSSLAYLRDLPIDHLKIDRSFIRNITEGPEESALAHSIIKLGSVFGLRIVGEGVETAGQAAVLRGLGCHTGQGYHFLRPADLDAVIAAITPAAAAVATATAS